jgi:hypothetical protein
MGPSGAVTAVSEGSGELNISISTPGGPTESGIQAVSSHDLTGACMRVRLPDTSGAEISTGGMFTGLLSAAGLPTTQDVIQLTMEDGALYAEYSLSGSVVRQGSLAFGSGAVVAAPGSGLPVKIFVPFSAGHSDEVVRDAVVAAVQSAASDSGLDVSIL